MKELSGIAALFLVNALEQKTKHIEILDNGWFPSTFTLRCKQQKHESVDEFMFRCMRDEYFDDIKEYLIGLHQSRKRHIDEAFYLYEKKRYLSAIPLLFLIVDGLPLDRGFGLIFQGKKNDSGNHAFQVLIFLRTYKNI